MRAPGARGDRCSAGTDLPGAVTFAQDEQSSVVFGMPGEAVRLGGASFTMNPEDIAFSVINLVKKTDVGGQEPW